MRIVLDANRCVGHGRCYALSPELFDADERGHSVVLCDEVPAGSEDDAQNAVANCPERAISLAD